MNKEFIFIMSPYEETLLLMVKEKERSDRYLLMIEWIIGILSVLVLKVSKRMTYYESEEGGDIV